MTPDELLEQIAGTLRHQIGPEVAEPFAKTQAFMASVVLEKLSRQLRLADAHALADGVDNTTLVHDVRVLLGSDASVPMRGALDAVEHHDAGRALGRLVESLYAERDTLGVERFDALLGRVRQTLRRRLDRQMEYAS